MTNKNRVARLLVIVVLSGALLILVFAITIAFAVTSKARRNASKYLRIVSEVRIGTSYDVVAARLRTAGVRVAMSGDCRRDCILNFHVDDRWLYELHFAPAVGFNGRLDFRNDTLVYKSTSMGQGTSIRSATVNEGFPPGGFDEPRLGETGDSSGNIDHIFVFLAPSDFTNTREQAYAFNLSCIGAIPACKADRYLPLKDLRRSFSKRREDK